MIDITKLYCNTDSLADDLRYGISKYPDSSYRKPVVVWNITQACNLKCLHCYNYNENISNNDELSTEQVIKVIDDLADFDIPALLLSGGEPLLRKDIFQIASYANKKNIRVVLSTNGTLIDYKIAKKIKEVGFSYVGLSLDGIGQINDKFRGAANCFDRTLNAFKYLKELNQRVGLRMTLTKYNIQDLNNIFNFIEQENIDRVCFYHLVYVGKGSVNFDITKEETRMAMDIILNKAKEYKEKGLNINILTVDNHVDGVYLYLKMLKENRNQAEEALKYIIWNGGGNNSSGVGIGEIDSIGNVHPDQFWQHYSFGNVLEKPFSTIWNDISDPLMKGLKNKKALLKGRCSNCKWIDLCGGSLRVRADVYYNDPWMQDPACYLYDNEIY